MARKSIKDPIFNYKIPKTDDVQAVKFIANWLNNRREQLYNNINDSKFYTMQNRNTGKWAKRHSLSYLNWFRGKDPERILTNKVYYTEIENSASAKNSNSTFGGKGGYNVKTREISVKDKNDMGTRVHERTHAMHADPQEIVVSDILKNNKFSFEKSASGGYDPRILDKDYWYNPREVYARLMEYRYNNKLNPNFKVDKNYLNNHRKELQDANFDIIDDNTLLRLFNDVAQNNNSNNSRYSLEDIYFA